MHLVQLNSYLWNGTERFHRREYFKHKPQSKILKKTPNSLVKQPHTSPRYECLFVRQKCTGLLQPLSGRTLFSESVRGGFINTAVENKMSPRRVSSRGLKTNATRHGGTPKLGNVCQIADDSLQYQFGLQREKGFCIWHLYRVNLIIKYIKWTFEGLWWCNFDKKAKNYFVKMFL